MIHLLPAGVCVDFIAQGFGDETAVEDFPRPLVEAQQRGGDGGEMIGGKRHGLMFLVYLKTVRAILHYRNGRWLQWGLLSFQVA